MLELHLFVNPLGMRCLRCEKDVLKIDRDLNTKISLYLPVIEFLSGIAFTTFLLT